MQKPKTNQNKNLFVTKLHLGLRLSWFEFEDFENETKIIHIWYL